MFYFIPAWYQQNRKWYQDIPAWHHSFESMNFDDTINQLKMFQIGNEAAKLMVLNYQPQFRYFLHKQDLSSTEYWSFFDDIQNIKKSHTKQIDFKALNWPKGTQFVYTPFFVLAYQDAKKLAEIHFGENGNLLRIQFFNGKSQTLTYFFDDRGFLSSILHFRQNEPYYQDYLNENGVWQVREVLVEGKHQIQVNEYADHHFQKKVYANWEELIKERLELFKQLQLKQEDCLVIASHHQHHAFLINLFKDHQLVHSFFSHRDHKLTQEDYQLLATSSDLIIADNEKIEQEVLQTLKSYSTAAIKLVRMTPFDARLRLGHSQNLKHLIIYWQIDGISEAQYEHSLQQLLALMEKNDLIQLKVVSYQPHRNMGLLKQQLIQKIEADYDVDRFMGLVENENENQLAEDQELDLVAVTFEQMTNENQIIAALDSARLTLDLSEEPDLYTQIASLSAGIPQINRIQTDYITHKENGWVLSNQSELNQAIEYYFTGLANWNKSLVHAVQKMGDYTSGRLIKQWKELLGIKHD